MANLDIENTMDLVKTIISDNIQSKIDAINTEKGDAFLIDFESSAYHLYSLPSVESTGIYSINFFQFMPGPLNVITDTKQLTAFNIPITILIDIRTTTENANRDERIALRYQREIKEIIEEKLISNFSEYKIIAMDMVSAEEAMGRQSVISTISFELTLC